MIRDGRLRSFKLGEKLVRVSVAAVEEYEQCQSSGLSNTEGNSPSNGTRTTASGIENPSEPRFLVKLSPNLPDFIGDMKPARGRHPSQSNTLGMDTEKALGREPQP
jgi:hypothetical protein